MSTTTFRQSSGLAAVVLAALLWTALVLVAVVQVTDWSGSLGYVGQSTISGVVGLLMLVGLLALLVGLLLTPGDTDPDPQPWPPR